MPTRLAPSSLQIVRNLERWAVLPFAATGGVLGAVAVGWLHEGGAPFSHMSAIDEVGLSAVGIVTAVLTWCALRVALLVKAPAGVAASTVGACVFFAVLNSSVSCMAVLLAAGPGSLGEVGEVLVVSVIAGVVGLPFAMPLGFLWGVAFVGPLYLVAKLRREPTLDGPDRVARAVGVTLAVVSGLGALVGWSFDFMPDALIAIGAVGGAAVIVTTVRLQLFSRFLRRVRLGVDEGWAIVDATSFDGPSEDLPRTDDAVRYPGGVLLRLVTAAAEGAYRTGGAARIPWARTTW